MAGAGRRGLVLAALVGSTLLWAAAPAAAHALPQSSEPPAGASLKQAPTTVRITFGEQPDSRLSQIRVLDTSGRDHTKGKTTPVPGDPRTLQVAVGPLPNGVYSVAWRTVSRVDGHLAAGTFAFGVGVSPSGAASGFSTKSPNPSTTSIVVRWLLYVGLMVLVGSAFLGVVCAPAVPRRLAPLLAGGWVVAAAGAAGITVDARGTARLAWSQLLGSSLGHELVWRGIPLLVAGAFLVAARLGRRRLWVALAGLAAMAAMWGDIESSHASAARSWRLLRMADQWGHFAAAGVWVGGLVALLVVVTTLARDERLRVAKRYSLAALCSIGVIAATGFQRAYDEIGSLHRLFHTGFGQWVVLKVVLLAFLVVLGAVNRYRSVPGVARSTGLLQRIGRGELALVAVVLLATGAIQGLAPPTTAAAPSVHPLVLRGSDLGTTVRAKLSISPGAVGFNRFVLSLVDFDSGKPIDGSVSLAFSFPERPDLGSSSLTLARTAAGVYSGQGANLSIDGTWNVVVTIQEASGGVQVSFTVTPRRPPERVSVQPQGAGLPTLYTIELPASQSVQTYLDPGHPGFNEFHVTFIGADGQELPMAALSARATPPSGAAAALVVRRLDTIGHFVADLPDAVAGRYRFDIDASTATGSSISGAVTIPVR